MACQGQKYKLNCVSCVRKYSRAWYHNSTHLWPQFLQASGLNTVRCASYFKSQLRQKSDPTALTWKDLFLVLLGWLLDPDLRSLWPPQSFATQAFPTWHLLRQSMKGKPLLTRQKSWCFVTYTQEQNLLRLPFYWSHELLREEELHRARRWACMAVAVYHEFAHRVLSAEATLGPLQFY